MYVPLEHVILIRARIATARATAAARFRDRFVLGETEATTHLEIQANALLEAAEGVRIARPIHYAVAGNVVTPYVDEGKPVFPFFSVDETPAAVFEYWLLISEILASPSWAMTRVIATSDEYDEALRRIDSPQIVRALPGSLLPSVEFRDNGTAMLEVTLYTRAVEERVERRSLLLDEQREFHFHGRELIAEGRGGITI
jgi:hypothetical protein